MPVHTRQHGTATSSPRRSDFRAPSIGTAVPAMLSMGSAKAAATPLVRDMDTSMPADSMAPLPGVSGSRLSVPPPDGASPAAEIPELEVPPMRVVVLLSGTQGDVMPFIQMAHTMAEKYGHVVRISSHDDLRKPVEDAGLRFYPMRGNARQMAGWGPSFSLHIPTLLNLIVNPATTKKLYVIRQVVLATIRACTEPDPADPSAEPFHADVVMANPMSFGHIHCAEALGVPLHLFFPNPWVATEDYPHSFSGWDYPCVEAPGTPHGYAWKRRPSNIMSYRLIDWFLWHGFLPCAVAAGFFFSRALACFATRSPLACVSPSVCARVIPLAGRSMSCVRAAGFARCGSASRRRRSCAT